MSKQHTAQAPVDPIVLGKMGSSYGIRGWLRVFSSTEDAESIFDYQPWLIQKAGQWQVVELESWRHHNQDIIIKLKGVDDRDAANLLTNCEIIVDSSQLPELEEGDYYWKDLMGCQVVTTEGYSLGKVIDMMETGSNDVLVIKANLKDAFGIKERLVPFLDGHTAGKTLYYSHGFAINWSDRTCRIILHAQPYKPCQLLYIRGTKSQSAHF